MNLLLKALLYFRPTQVCFDVETSGGIEYIYSKNLFGKKYEIKREWVSSEH